MTDTRGINYGHLMHQAMRGLIRTVLADVQENGLPGDHHFFITFDTTHPDVDIADWLSDHYPGDMTVVMQHWYDNLEVDDDGFSVTLNFGDSPETLYIPFDSIQTFVDPSVEFGLRFDGGEVDEEDEEEAEILPAPRKTTEVELAEPEEKDAPHKDAEVVRLDTFRK